MIRIAVLTLAFATALAAGPAAAQSEAASQVSAVSVAPSTAVAASSLSTIAGVGALTVESLERSGELVIASLRAGAGSAAFAIELSAETVHALGIAVGTTLEASATAEGWIIRCAGRAVAFVPDASTARLIHHREFG